MPNGENDPNFWIIMGVIIAVITVIVAIIAMVLQVTTPQLPTTPIFEGGGDTDTDGNYEISWERSIRATSYILEEDRDHSFTNPRTIYTNSGTKKQIDGKSNGEYYYRVRACNDAGESDWSSIQKMSVVPFHSATPTTTPRPTPLVATPTKTPKLMPTPPTTVVTPTPTSIVTTPTPTPVSTSATTSTPTPSPTPTVTPTPSPTPTGFPFLEPKEGDYVIHKVPAKVQVGDLSEIPYLWFVTVPLPPLDKQYHPQGSGVPYRGPGEYDIIGFVGNSRVGADDGYMFRILIVGTDENGSKSFEDYIRTAATLNYPGLSHLPETAKMLGNITVIRRDKITLTYNDFDLDDVCTSRKNYCKEANKPGKAVIFGSMTKSNIPVPAGASKLEVTICICCNGDGEGLSGPAGSAAYIRVDSEERAERIDSTMNSHHGRYYKYEYCDTFSNTFIVEEREEVTLKIEMSGGARLDFEKAELTFS